MYKLTSFFSRNIYKYMKYICCVYLCNNFHKQNYKKMYLMVVTE